MAAVCIQLENLFTTLLVISTVFIPTWLRHALVTIFLLSNLNITVPINPSSSSDRRKNPRYRDPAIFSPSQLYSAVADGAAEKIRYWLAVLFSARLRPAFHPANSNQSRINDFLSSRDLLHSLNRSIISRSNRSPPLLCQGLGRSKRGQQTKASVHW
jgi:hypothetical protein